MGSVLDSTKIKYYSKVNHTFSFCFQVHIIVMFTLSCSQPSVQNIMSRKMYAAAAAKSPSVVSDSVRPYRRQPTRLPRPWDSPGKNTGVGCHFLLHCIKVKSESEVAQSCPTLSDPMNCSPPGCSVHGIFQARVLCLLREKCIYLN